MITQVGLVLITVSLWENVEWKFALCRAWRVDLRHQARLGHTVLMPSPSQCATTSHDYRSTESTHSHLLTLVHIIYETDSIVHPLIMGLTFKCLYVCEERESVFAVYHLSLNWITINYRSFIHIFINIADNSRQYEKAQLLLTTRMMLAQGFPYGFCINGSLTVDNNHTIVYWQTYI